MTIPGIDDAFDAADAILWPEGRNAASDGPGSKLISDALVAACTVVAAATREAVAVEILDVRDGIADLSGLPGAYRDGLRDAADIARRVPVGGKEQQQ